MRTKIFKYIFFITIVILIIISILIIDKDKNNESIEVKKRDIDSVISKNVSIGVVSVDSFNPHISKNQDVQYLSKLIFRDLIKVNIEFKLEPGLAKEWSKIAPKVYLIKLNEDIYWHNGEQFNSKDVEFTINELKKNLNNSIYKENVKDIETVEIIDDYTIKIHIREEKEFFEYNLCFPVLCRNMYETNNLINGTGDYKVDEVNERYIVLKEMIKTKIPRKIKVNIYNNYSELYGAFSKGEVDIITTSNIDFNKYVGTIGLEEEKIIGRKLNYLKINTESGFLEDENIRKAINIAINKNKIVYDVFNNKTVNSDFPLNCKHYLGQVEEKENYDINNSKECIANSGWKYKNGYWTKGNAILEFDLIVKEGKLEKEKIAQKLKEQLEKADIKIKIVEIPEDVYNSKIQNGEYELLLCEDILPIFPNIKKYFDIQNEEARQLFENIKNIEEEEQLKSVYNRLFQIFKEENSTICLTFNSITILHNSSIKGNFSGNWYDLFYNIDTWYKEL